MGVPKFFRWLSERYPLCSQLVQENSIPEFDNLYLDMNGIIHHCTHGNNDSVHFRMSQEQQFSMIFHYIEFIFAKIKPRKVFFMAVDGVAPRAKINQQRSRRFKTAHEAAESVRKALENGEVLPDQAAFDSNCITPGTEFMQSLNETLHYFIRKKISQDQQWKDCKVIFSGHDVPGEGEHKVMEYIRLSRAQPEYNPNTRHCLYGLDADLIMLGLVTHDPHFCLLREEVVFGPKNTKKTSIIHPESQKFYLLHLSLLREYLDIEFSVLKESLPFEYNLERILDDFIMMTVFVGNDFLPHLPGLHINEGALTVMFDCYKSLLPSLNDYINDGGTINTHGLEMLLTELAKYELSQFEEEYVDVEYITSKSRKGKVSTTITKRQKEIVGLVALFLADPCLNQISLPSTISTVDRAFALTLCSELGLHSFVSGGLNHKTLFISRKPPRVSDDDENEEEEGEVTDEEDKGKLKANDKDDESSDDEESEAARFRVIKKYESFKVEDDQTMTRDEKIQKAFQESSVEYYREKLKINTDDKESLNRFCGSYLQGLQWVMHYYYNGVQSWGWYFPYYYSPKINDLVPNVKEKLEMMGDFEMGEPFKPFEQLMGVMPVRSKNLLPEAFQSLMYDSSSPILDFYPLEFETDLNGKKNAWEAVVKIPFIEEKRLLEAMSTKAQMLTFAEKKRNERGNPWIFSFDTSVEPFLFKSPLPGVFPDIVHCSTKASILDLPVVEKEAKLKKGLLEGTRLGKSALAGFPSLRTLEFIPFISKHGVRVFQQESKSDSVVISLNYDPHARKSSEIAQMFLGRTVFVGWPFLSEAMVESISDSLFTYRLDSSVDFSTAINRIDKLTPNQIKQEPHQPAEVERWQVHAERTKEQYSSKAGVIIGDVEVFFHVSVLKGMKLLDNGALVKNFGKSDSSIDYPLQTIVFDVENVDTRFVEKPAPSIYEEFPLKTRGFYIVEGTFYGSLVEIVGYSASKKSLSIKLMNSSQISNQPLFGKNIAKKSYLEQRYFTANFLAKSLSISHLALSRICSSVFLDVPSQNVDRLNIGLGLKFEGKQLKVSGYTRKTLERGWEYSTAAFDLIKEYHSKFPTIFMAVGDKKREYFRLEDLFPNVSINEANFRLEELKNFLKEKNVKGFDKVSLEMEIMDSKLVQELESAAEEFLQKNSDSVELSETDSVINGVPAHVILLPSQAPYRLSKDQKFQLGDRVLFAADVGSAETGSFGTIVGIEKKSSSVTQNTGGYWLYVVFDKPFLGGNTLDNRCKEKRGLVVSSECLLNLTNPQPPLHRRFVPSEHLKTQLSQLEKSLSVVNIVDGEKVYEKKAGQRSLLTTLNKAPNPNFAQATTKKISAPSQVDLVTDKIKELLNISPAETARNAPAQNGAAHVNKVRNESVCVPPAKRKNETLAFKPVVFVPEKTAKHTVKLSDSTLAFTPTSVLQKISKEANIQNHGLKNVLKERVKALLNFLSINHRDEVCVIIVYKIISEAIGTPGASLRFTNVGVPIPAIPVYPIPLPYVEAPTIPGSFRPTVPPLPRPNYAAQMPMVNPTYYMNRPPLPSPAPIIRPNTNNLPPTGAMQLPDASFMPKFTNSPFYEIIRLVEAPRLLPVWSPSPFKFNVSLPVDVANSLNITIKAYSQIEDVFSMDSVPPDFPSVLYSLYLFGFVYKPPIIPTQRLEVYFPHKPNVSVADRKAAKFSSRGPDGPLYVPVDLTPLIRNGNTDVFTQFPISIDFEIASNPLLICIALVRNYPVSSIHRLVTDSAVSRTSPEEVKKKFFSSSNDDVKASKLVLSLKCPLLYTQIKVPVRGFYCEHLQCFDLFNYLMVQKQSATWMCPICHKQDSDLSLGVGHSNSVKNTTTTESSFKLDLASTEPGGLQVCGYTMDIISEIENNYNGNFDGVEVEISELGDWLVKSLDSVDQSNDDEKDRVAGGNSKITEETEDGNILGKRKRDDEFENFVFLNSSPAGSDQNASRNNKIFIDLTDSP